MVKMGEIKVKHKTHYLIIDDGTILLQGLQFHYEGVASSVLLVKILQILAKVLGVVYLILFRMVRFKKANRFQLWCQLAFVLTLQVRDRRLPLIQCSPECLQLPAVILKLIVP